MKPEEILKQFEEQKRKAENRIDNLTEEKMENSKRTSEEVNLLKDMLTTMNDLISVNNAQKQLLNQQNELYPEGYISTTQYWDDSLAKNLYNMNGNSLANNSYMAVRQLLGIVNGSAKNTTNNFTQQQQMSGIQNESLFASNANNNINNNNIGPNGTGVGLVKNEDIQIQGWWLWIFILNRIEYFANLVEWECEDKRLKRVLQDYMFNAVCGGRAVILRKEIDGEWYYRALAINDYGEDKWGKPKEKVDCYSMTIVLNSNLESDEIENIDLGHKDVVYGMWRSNGYNIWFYVLSYLMNAVDLLYIFWNKTRMTKTVVLQKKANAANGSKEAKAIVNPYQLVVPIATAGYGDSKDVSLENRYQVEELGNPDVNNGLLENFYSWMSYWDGVIGIRTVGDKVGDNRSITDEIRPFNLRTDKIQHTMLICLDAFVEQVKEKWGMEISYKWKDEEASEMIEQSNPAFKNEGGNQEEMELNNGQK